MSTPTLPDNPHNVPLRASVSRHPLRNVETGNGEPVSLHVGLNGAQRALRELRNAFGGSLESPNTLHAGNGYTYQVWCV